MARIRTIKPEFWSSPAMRGLDPYARLLFIAMWNWADDVGRGSANPGELRGFAFPNDDEIELADIRRMLGGIRRAFGVVFYEVDERPYYYIPSWDKHQKIDKRSTPRHPGPDDGSPFNPDPEDASYQQEQADSEETRRVPPSARRDLGAGTGEQGNRGTEKNSSSPAPPARGLDGAAPNPDDENDAGALPGMSSLPAPSKPPEPGSDDDPDWTKFWSIYPNGSSKIDARKAWAKAIKKAAPFVIIAGAERYRELVTRENREKKHIKHASGWLNGERWNDDFSPSHDVPGAVARPGRAGSNVHHELAAGEGLLKGF